MKQGDVIYFKDDMSDEFLHGTVEAIADGNVYIQSVKPYVRYTCKKEQETFKTLDDLKKYYDNLEKEKYEQYITEIRDLKTLAMFPLVHCIYPNAEQDKAALKAYRTRARELFGIYLDS